LLSAGLSGSSSGVTGQKSEGLAVGGVESQGFWKSCSPEVRQRLIDSKAEMHIAENKLKCRRAEEQFAKTEGSEAVVRHLISVMELSQKLRAVKDEKVGGWVETVADTYVKSAAESVPSSIPSLESVGYGKSALKSSDGVSAETPGSSVEPGGKGSGVKTERQIEYDIRVRDLEEYFEGLDAYTDEEYRGARADLDHVYSDVTGKEKPKVVDIRDKVEQVAEVVGLTPEQTRKMASLLNFAVNCAI